MLTLYERSDLVTPITSLPIADLAPGADSSVAELVAMNETGTEIHNVLLVMRTESLSTTGLGVASGVPPQDELWGRLQIVGYDDTGEPGWSVPTTGVRSIGASSGVLVARIPDGCGVELDFWAHPPGSAIAANSWKLYLLGLGDEYSQPIPPSVGDVSRGILLAKAAGVVRGCDVTPTGTPDDQIHVGSGLVELESGELAGKITTDHTLDQNDSAPAALGSGEAYKVAVTVGPGGAVTITKGAKGASPVQPTPPAGELLRAWVHVDYGAGGSVIDAADIDQVEAEGRYLAVADSGLFVKVYPGQSLSRTTWTYRGDSVLVPVVANDTNWGWLLPTGLWEVTQEEVAPAEGARCYWEADTDGSGVTEMRDRRTYAGDQVLLRLRGDSIASPPQTLDILLAEHDELVLEDVVGRVSDNGGGSAGQTVLDVHLDGTTIYTDSATEDLRPTIAWDATGAGLVHRGGVHQVTRIRRGQELSLVAVEYPDTDASPPAWAEVTLVCRRR